jgi:hypothetical protein
MLFCICRTYCIQILREFLYFQNLNWEKNFEVCTFGINKCMKKDWKKGTGVKLCTINVLSLLSLRSIWTGRTSSLQVAKMASRFRVRHPTLWRTFSPLDLQAEFPDLDSEDSEGEETGKGITTKQWCVHRSKTCCQTLKHFDNVFATGENNVGYRRQFH